MRLDRIDPTNGRKRCIRAVIETPKGSRAKFSYDPKLKGMVLKRTLPEGMVFPYDFGFIPATDAEDGDPLDVLVLMDVPTFPGCIIECRLVGMLRGRQWDRKSRGVRNDRYLAVERKSVVYRDVVDIEDFPREFLRQLQEFFRTYNRQMGKRFKPAGILGAKAAWRAIATAQR